MSTLTDSEDARRECCRDTASAAIARLTRERDEARAQVAAIEQLIDSWREVFPHSQTEFAHAVRECAAGVEQMLERVSRG